MARSPIFVKYTNGELVYFTKPLKTPTNIIFAPTDQEMFDNGWCVLNEPTPINPDIAGISIVELIMTNVVYRGTKKPDNPEIGDCWCIVTVNGNTETEKFYIVSETGKTVTLKDNSLKELLSGVREKTYYVCKTVTYKYHTDNIRLDLYLDNIANTILLENAMKNGYDSIESLCTYRNCGNDSYSNEAENFVLWRTKVWEYINELKNTAPEVIEDPSIYQKDEIIRMIEQAKPSE